LDETGTDRIDDLHKDDWYGAGLPLHRCQPWWGVRHDHVRCHSHQVCSVSPHTIGVAGSPAIGNPNRAAVDPAEFVKSVVKSLYAGVRQRIVFGLRHKHADLPHAIALLRTRRERPSCGAAKKCDELAPLHVSPLCKA
jgi:hypothetical protein